MSRKKLHSGTHPIVGLVHFSKPSSYYQNLDMGLEIRELTTVVELEGCVKMQSAVFNLPTIELSPVRHFIVTMHAGGFTLGAFQDGELIGFTLSVPAVVSGLPAFYSHMTAVVPEYQGYAIGYKLKLAQRKIALKRGVRLIKWTFQPEQSRNAYFNLEKLGAEVRQYMPNFYGTDYGTDGGSVQINSDRLFALWVLDSAKPTALAEGKTHSEGREPDLLIDAIDDWGALLNDDRMEASRQQERLREELSSAFTRGFVCRGFRRPPIPKYLLYREEIGE